MTEWKCPFCGSKEPMVQALGKEVVLNNKGQYVSKTHPCCRSQGRNLQWQRKHENPMTHEKPKLEEISKW